MRYIDEMLREIPIEELMGDGLSANNEGESLAIIPDVPTVYRQPAEVRESYTQNIREKTTETTETEQILSEKTTPAVSVSRKRPAEKKQRAKVKSRSMGVLAAALTLVLAAGAVTAYFGVVKHTGPLAAVFNSGEPSDEEKALANKNAKEVFIAVNGLISDLMADGKISMIEPKMYTMDLAGHLSEYDEFQLELIKQMQENPSCPSNGEIVYQIGSSKKIIFAQWRQKDGSYVGQYPNPKDGLTFGVLDDTPDVDQSSIYYIDWSDPEAAADRCAKLVYTTVNGRIADLIADGRISEIERGEHMFMLSQITLSEDEKIVAEILIDANVSKDSQVYYRVSDNNKIEVAQWRASAGSFVGQYPNPGKELSFGTYSGNSILTEENSCGAHVVQNMKHFWRDLELADYSCRVENIFYQAVFDADAVSESELGAELYGEMISVTLEPSANYTAKGAVTISSSDRAGADFKINDKYYRSDLVRELLIGFKTGEGFRKRNDDSMGIWNHIGSEQSVKDWYTRFREEGLTPVRDVGEETAPPDMLYAVLNIDGELVEVASSKYSNANICVNGQYYNTKNVSILNMIYFASVSYEDARYNAEAESSYCNIGYQPVNPDEFEKYTDVIEDISLPYTYEDIINAPKKEVSGYATPSTGGMRYEIVLVDEKSGRMLLITSPDKANADVIIDGKYYQCDMARELFTEAAKKAGLSYRLNGEIHHDTSIGTERLEKWYNDFMATDPAPIVTTNWIESELPIMAVSFTVDDELISICISQYQNSNIIINNRYYNCEDIYDLTDLIRDVIKNKG